MRKKLSLERTDQYYRNRLKELSIQNDVYDVVIEARGDSFVLYRNTPALMRWEKIEITAQPNNYKAIITFEGPDIWMEVKMKTPELWAKLIGCLAITCLAIYLMLQGNPAWLFSGLVVLSGFIFYRMERSRFKKFIAAFLNNLQ